MAGITGPFDVIRVIDSHDYMIQKHARAKPVIVHRDELKLYQSPEIADEDV
jgi:hypothetical protein